MTRISKFAKAAAIATAGCMMAAIPSTSIAADTTNCGVQAYQICGNGKWQQEGWSSYEECHAFEYEYCILVNGGYASLSKLMVRKV